MMTTAVLYGGAGAFWLAHAEATMQAHVPNATPAHMQHWPQLLTWLQCRGTAILQAATGGMTPQLARTLSKHSVVPTMLQVHRHKSGCATAMWQL